MCILIKAILCHLCYKLAVPYDLRHTPQGLSCCTAQDWVGTTQRSLKWPVISNNIHGKVLQSIMFPELLQGTCVIYWQTCYLSVFDRETDRWTDRQKNDLSKRHYIKNLVFTLLFLSEVMMESYRQPY